MRFLIDGYNLIFSRRRPGRPLRPVNVAAARESILGLLARYKAATGDLLVVFFDGSPQAVGFLRRERVQGIDVVFSYPDQTADEDIKEHITAIKGRTGVHLVSSDNSLKAFAKRLGIKVIDSQTFMARVRKALGRQREEADEAEPLEKFQGPHPSEVEYWLKIFQAPKSARSDLE